MNRSKITSSIDNEYNIKEQLYTLFYELTSEIKGQKIEIDEDEFEENVRSASFEQILNYIRSSLRIILNREKPTEKVNPIIPNKSDLFQYESMLKNLESQKRLHLRNEFHYKMQKEALENKIEELIETEKEYEEMKAKFKYEDGKFLENDRKENEIFILRAENTNLKNIIAQQESQNKKSNCILDDKNKVITELKDKNDILNKKIKKFEKDLNLVSNINININNANAINNSNLNSIIHHHTSKCSFCVSNNPSEIKGKIHSQVKFLNLKEVKHQMNRNTHENNNNNCLSERLGDYSSQLGNQRNNSMNLLFDKRKLDLMAKFFSNKVKRQGKYSSLNITGKSKKVKNGPISISQSGFSNRSNTSSLLRNYNITNSKPNNSSSSNNTTKNKGSKGFCLGNYFQKTPINYIIKNKVSKVI